MDKFDPTNDYYAVLGATETASAREIERLYKRLARTHHPDRGGAEERMKAINEAYRVLHDTATRGDYDAHRRQPLPRAAAIKVAAPVREVGVSGQLLSSFLCMMLGLLLLFLVRFNGLWFLWPLAILAMGVVLIGVLMAHSAMTNARDLLRASHPARRFRAAQEIAFWSIVFLGVYGVYLIFTTI